MIDRYTEHTYLINLKDREERLIESTKQCDSIGLSFEVFEAVDGEKENVQYTPNVSMDGWNQNAAGLVETTIRILEDAKAKNYKSILILEDDIKFKPVGLIQMVMDELLFPEDWDLFHFGTIDITSPDKIRNRLMRLNSSFCCHCYAVHSKIYDEFIFLLKKMDKPLDWVTAYDFHPRLRSYKTNPSIAEQSRSYSNIRKRVVEHVIH